MKAQRISQKLDYSEVGDMIKKTGKYVRKMEENEVPIKEEYQLALIKPLWGDIGKYMVAYSELFIKKGWNK